MAHDVARQSVQGVGSSDRVGTGRGVIVGGEGGGGGGCRGGRGRAGALGIRIAVVSKVGHGRFRLDAK